jgi:drug/metabolite transporter (DMT)-like permease
LDGTTPYIGEAFALLTAIAWAFAVILFKKSGETVHPIGLNLFKDLFALVLFLPTMWLFGETLWRDAPAGEYALLLASGALGIGLGDTFFFKSLNLLGAGLTAIVDCLYSPFIIGLSLLFLAERLSVLQGVGAALVVAAVLAASLEWHKGLISRRDLGWGILYGVLGLASMAVGIVMIKPLLERSPLLWATEVRVAGGVAALAVILLFHRRRRAIVSSVVSNSARHWGYVLGGSFAGAYLAMVLWLAGMKYTQASVASALNQTANVFIFIFAALLLREPITRRRTLGIILGFLGAVLVSFG